MDFHKISYQAHAEKALSTDKYKTWIDEDTVDYWRHERMYNLLLPFLKNYKNANWLTIGDGRYGTDAHFISKYTDNVIATDINDVHLRLAKKDGYIKDYQVENAEQLSFSSNSFDFVFCKEAYHHFPRPSIALCEMLQVAKTAVILIEPNDQNTIPTATPLTGSFSRLWQDFKNSIKHVLGRETYYEYGNYEKSGNYVYTVSKREMEKVALGLNLPHLVTKDLNDHYKDGVEYENASQNGPLLRSLKKKIKSLNYRSQSGLSKSNILFTAIFNESISGKFVQDLNTEQYNVINLPRNPYLDV